MSRPAQHGMFVSVAAPGSAFATADTAAAGLLADTSCVVAAVVGRSVVAAGRHVAAAALVVVVAEVVLAITDVDFRVVVAAPRSFPGKTA